MPDNLRDAASVQYSDFTGTIAGDEVDFSGLEPLLGIDRGAWQLIAVEFACYGGSQYLRAWGVSTSVGGWTGLEQMIAERGQVEVTRLVDRAEHIEGHSDTNPPRPPGESRFGLVGTFLVFGFKRLEARIITKHLPDATCPIVEVDSVIEEDEG